MHERMFVEAERYETISKGNNIYFGYTENLQLKANIDTFINTYTYIPINLFSRWGAPTYTKEMLWTTVHQVASLTEIWSKTGACFTNLLHRFGKWQKNQQIISPSTSDMIIAIICPSYVYSPSNMELLFVVVSNHW